MHVIKKLWLVVLLVASVFVFFACNLSGESGGDDSSDDFEKGEVENGEGGGFNSNPFAVDIAYQNRDMNGRSIHWNANKNASAYAVYRYCSDKFLGWYDGHIFFSDEYLVATTTETSYLDTFGPPPDETPFVNYLVCLIDSNGKLSDKLGRIWIDSYKRFTPNNASILINDDERNICIGWDKQEGITSYNIYRRAMSNSYIYNISTYIGGTDELVVILKDDDELVATLEVDNSSGETRMSYTEDFPFLIGDTSRLVYLIQPVKGSEESCYCAFCETEKNLQKFILPGVGKIAYAKNSDTNTVTLTWNALEGAKSYRVYIKDDSSSEYKKCIASGIKETSYTANFEFVAEKSYVTYYVAAENDTCIGFTSSVNVSMLLPSAASFKTVPNEKKVSLSWNAVSNAKKYKLYRLESAVNNVSADDVVKNGTCIQLGNVTSYTDTPTKISGSSPYVKYVLIAENDSVSGECASATADFSSYFPPRVYNLNATLNESTKKITVTWDKVTEADEYKIFYYGSSKNNSSDITAETVIIGGRTAGSVTSTSYTFSPILDYYTPYIYIVCVAYKNGLSGNLGYRIMVDCSNIVPPPPPNAVSGLSAKMNLKTYETKVYRWYTSISLKWDVVSNASSYKIYRYGPRTEGGGTFSTPTSGYSLIATTSNTSYTDTSVSTIGNGYYSEVKVDNTTQYYRYYYYVVAVNQYGESGRGSIVKAQ